MLLTSAWQRMLIAAIAVASMWLAVWWVTPSTPSITVAQPAVLVPATKTAATFGPMTLRPIVLAGQPAPGGGRFDRFEVSTQPVVAPVNARGQVAFYATVVHAFAREGVFLAEAGRISKVAAFGDPVPGGGMLGIFSDHPLPALNAAGHVAFDAEVAGGRATEGVFLARNGELHVIALADDDAPGIPGGVLLGFDTPALNDNDELAFVATVRRGRDTLHVLYFWNGRRLQRLVAEGELLLRVGGVMDGIGMPALNNNGVVAFPAAILKGPVLGGIFVAGTRELRLLVAAGDRTPDGAMIQRFSEQIAIDDNDAITFGAYLGPSGSLREAVLRRGADGLATIALEGAAAPGGGRYDGFGPWPTVAADGDAAFTAALAGGPGPLAAFVGTPGHVRRVATMGEALPGGGQIGRFVLNAVAVAGPGGGLTFATMADRDGEQNAIYCRCPLHSH